MIPVEELLKSVSEAKPCGEDVSYDPRFQKLETLMKGTPESQLGDVVKEAEEPDWKEVCDQAVALLKESKHLRVAVILCLGLLKKEGIAGFRDGLTLLRGLLEKYWLALYPNLDPEDNNDPTERINLLNNLSAPLGTFGDPYQFLLRLLQAPLCVARGLGPISQADVAAARNPAEAAGAGRKGVTAAQIEAALREADAAALQTTHDAVAQSIEAIKGIDDFFAATSGGAVGANLEELRNTLKQMQRTLAPFLAGGTGGLADEGGAEATGDEGAAAGQAGGPAYSGRIQSRDDVLKALDEICKFYQRTEPASPVPYILKRARRLVKMNFMEIMNELTPDALSQLKVITGQEEEAAGSPSESPSGESNA